MFKKILPKIKSFFSLNLNKPRNFVLIIGLCAIVFVGVLNPQVASAGFWDIFAQSANLVTNVAGGAATGAVVGFASPIPGGTLIGTAVGAGAGAYSAFQSGGNFGNSVAGKVLQTITWLFIWLYIGVMGKIATMLMNLTVITSSFTGFTNASFIQDAWTIMRDISNLAFIIILLVIAFATILKIESYSYKKLLPKMIIIAILINFSNIICGVIIDGSQIVMLTFVKAYEGAGVQGLYSALHMDDLINISTITQNASGGSNPVVGSITGHPDWDYFLALVIAGVLLTFITVALLIFWITLLARIVLLWVLTILSPIGFTATILPITQKYGQMWWSAFGRFAVLGPFLAGGLWLTLYVGLKADGTTSIISTGTTLAAGPVVLTYSTLFDTSIAIIMILAVLNISNSLSSEIGNVTGKAAELPQKAGKWYAGIPKWAAFGAGAGVGAAGAFAGKQAGGWAGRRAKLWGNRGIDRIYKETNIDLNPTRSFERKKKGFEAIGMDNARQGLHGAYDIASKGGAGGWLVGKFGAQDFNARYGGLRRSLKAGKDEKERQSLIADLEKHQSERDDKVKQASESRDRKVEQQQNTIDSTSNQQARLSDLEGAISKGTQLSKEQLASLRELTAGMKRQDRAKISGALQILEQHGRVRSGQGKEDMLDAIGKQHGNLQKRRERLEQRRKEQQEAFERKKDQISSDYDPKIKPIKDRLTELGPRFVSPNMEVEAMGLVSEHMKASSSDNEEMLQEKTKGLISSGKNGGLPALALLMQAFSVGHPNEIQKIFDGTYKLPGQEEAKQYGTTARDMEAMVDDVYVGHFGLDKQLVLSMLNVAQQNAVKNGHNSVGWMIGHQGGEYSFRDRKEHQLFISVETSKKGLEKCFHNDGHLGWGEYDGSKDNWQMLSGMVHMLSQADDGIIKKIKDGRLTMNTNLVKSMTAFKANTYAVMNMLKERNKDLYEEIARKINYTEKIRNKMTDDQIARGNKMLEKYKKDMSWLDDHDISDITSHSLAA